MKIEIDLDILADGSSLFRKCLKDKRVLSNSMVYILDDYFPNLSLLYLDGGLSLLEDKETGRRYKVFCSSSGKFVINQSCTKGAGRDDSMGSWKSLVSNYDISGVILVNTSQDGKVYLTFVLNDKVTEEMAFG